MLLAQRYNRLIVLAAGVFVVLVCGFLLRPSSITWPTTNGPARFNEDYLDAHYQPPDDTDEGKVKGETPIVSAVAPAAPKKSAEALPVKPKPAALPVAPQEEKDQYLGYNRLFSEISPDKKWYLFDFGLDFETRTPSLLPHPFFDDVYIMVASTAPSAGAGPSYSQALVCEAAYIDFKMKCLHSPTTLPIAATTSEHCTGDFSMVNDHIGPLDPRMFYGPGRPYVTYGSASQYTCLGQWIHDLRRLSAFWETKEALDRRQRFFSPTELQRPVPYRSLETEWFAFWDDTDMYVNYELYPKRSYAKISRDGSAVSENLASATAELDQSCMQRYMALTPDASVDQATNSLSVTMCERGNATCNATANTFILTLVQNTVNGVQEARAVLINQTPPFAVHAIANKPVWFHGRGKPGYDLEKPSETQAFKMNTVAWKFGNETYHGHMNDELLISFTVDGTASGGMDVVASNLLADMSLCSTNEV